MKNAFYVFAMLCMVVAVVGCGGGKDEGKESKTSSGESGGDAKKEISLEVADLEKLKSWEDFGNANAKLTEKLVDVMDSVKDKASAEAAIPKFKALAPKFAAVNRAEKAAGDASDEDRKLVLTILADAHKRFNASFEKLSENEELYEMVKEPLDKAYVGDDS